MTLLIIILAITTCLADFLKDEVKHKYSRFFGKIIPPKMEWWFNPAISHLNKWKFDSKFLDLLFSTALVWVTDFWHFLKAIFITSIILMILLIENNSLLWWQYLIELLVVEFAWGVLWETFNGITGALSDKIK